MNHRDTCDRCGTVFISAARTKFKQPCGYCRQSDFDQAVKGLQGSDPLYAKKLAEAKSTYLNLS